MPFHCDDERTDRWAFETLRELMSFVGSDNLDRSTDDDKPLAEIVPAVSFKRNDTKDPPLWSTDPRGGELKFQTLAIDELYKASISQNFRLPKRELIDGAGYQHSWLFHPPIVDSPRMLTVSSSTRCYDVCFVMIPTSCSLFGFYSSI
jgi:D-amino-acid oxidase